LKPVLNANVSVMYRGMLKCPNCRYTGTSRRSMTRHALGHHGAEWPGPGQPLRLVPLDQAADAQERLRRLRLNSRQRREERDRGRQRPPSTSSPPPFPPLVTPVASTPASARRRRPVWTPPDWSPPRPRRAWAQQTVSPVSSGGSGAGAPGVESSAPRHGALGPGDQSGPAASSWSSGG